MPTKILSRKWFFDGRHPPALDLDLDDGKSWSISCDAPDVLARTGLDVATRISLADEMTEAFMDWCREADESRKSDSWEEHRGER